MFQERLKLLREAKGITAKKAALDVGIPYTTYRNYENGVCEPNISVLIKFSLYFEISVDWLVGNDDSEKNLPPETKWEELRKFIESLSDESLLELRSYVKFLKWKEEHTD